MRISALSLAFAASAILISGCSGANGATQSYAPVANASHVSPHDGNCGDGNGGDNVMRAADEGGTCGDNNLQLIAPLSFSGGGFSPAPYASCGQFQVGSAPNYVAPSSGPLTLSAKGLALFPMCAPNPMPSQIDIVAVRVKVEGNSGKVRADSHGWAIVATTTQILSTDWIFAPASPGLSMQQSSSYEFFLAVPASGNGSGGGDDD
jgi:hypothetical protein